MNAFDPKNEFWNILWSPLKIEIKNRVNSPQYREQSLKLKLTKYYLIH